VKESRWKNTIILILIANVVSSDLSDDNTVAAGSNGLLWSVLLVGGAVVIRVSTSGASTVEHDTLTGTGDAVSRARARAGVGGDAGWGGAVGDAGGERWDIRVAVGVIIVGVIVVEARFGKLGSKSSECGLLESLGDVTWADWHWRADLGGWSASWDLGGGLAGG